MRKRPIHLPLVALALLVTATPALHAIEPNYGFQFGLASTTGDLSEKAEIKTMAGIGLHMVLPVASDQAVRPRLDFWSGSKEVTVVSGPASVTTKVSFSTFLVGADYLYFLQGGRDQGPYLLGGLGLSSNSATLELNVNGVAVKDSGSCTKPAYTLGAGYQLGRRWGLEARYNATSFQAKDEEALNVNTVSFAATFRFN